MLKEKISELEAFVSPKPPRAQETGTTAVKADSVFRSVYRQARAAISRLDSTLRSINKRHILEIRLDHDPEAAREEFPEQYGTFLRPNSHISYLLSQLPDTPPALFMAVETLKHSPINLAEEIGQAYTSFQTLPDLLGLKILLREHPANIRSRNGALSQPQVTLLTTMSCFMTQQCHGLSSTSRIPHQHYSFS